jgi:hypothetical protein
VGRLYAFRPYLFALGAWLALVWFLGEAASPVLISHLGFDGGYRAMTGLAVALLLLCIFVATWSSRKASPAKTSARTFVPQEGALHRELVLQAIQRQPTAQDQEEEARRREAEARERQRQWEAKERERQRHREAEEKERQRQREASSNAMTRSKALEILGLQSGATTEEIRAAYIKIIKRVHQDAGGSDYLAKQVNAARDILLGSAKR